MCSCRRLSRTFRRLAQVTTVHADAAQPFVATWGNAQACPHVPQLFGSSVVLTQAPLHKTFGVVHPVSTHWPPWQASVPPAIAHALPHVPQLRAFVFKLTSQPFAEFLSQSAYPVLHPDATQLHELPIGLQAQLALSPLHAFPHIPQLAIMSSRASQPSIALPLQSA